MKDVILRAMIAYLERPSGALYFDADDPENATIDGYMLNLPELAAAIETAIKAGPVNETSAGHSGGERARDGGEMVFALLSFARRGHEPRG